MGQETMQHGFTATCGAQARLPASVPPQGRWGGEDGAEDPTDQELTPMSPGSVYLGPGVVQAVEIRCPSDHLRAQLPLLML